MIKTLERLNAKKITLCISLLLGICLTHVPVFGDTLVKVAVNGTNLEMKEPPVIISGRTLVPLRAIFEALGVTPNWDGNTKTVSAKTDTVDMSLIIGGSTAMVNNKSVQLEVPGTLVNGSTMVPARFIAETFGATVSWESDTKTVIINTAEQLDPVDSITTQGTLTYPIGAKYVGSIKDGKANGQGTMTYEEGSICIGNFKDDKRSGQGTTTNPDGAVYVGLYKDDMRSGQGTMTFPDGSKYVGEWKDHKMDGKGTYTGTNGYSYVGDYVEGAAYGNGTETLSNGMVFVGEFKKKDEIYKGTYTWPDGRILTTSYLDDMPKGMGTYTGADKKVIVGWFTGHGVEAATQTWPDGTKYSGPFKMEKYIFTREGTGSIVYPDGSSYVGQWKNDLYNGQGTYTNAEGAKHIGEWKDGKPLGFAPIVPTTN